MEMWTVCSPLPQAELAHGDVEATDNLHGADVRVQQQQQQVRGQEQLLHQVRRHLLMCGEVG